MFYQTFISFINYYLNLGFDNIYIYEIINDISKYDRKLKNSLALPNQIKEEILSMPH